MSPIQNSKSLRHFAKHLFLTSKIHSERKKAKDDIDGHLQNMRKSVVRMNLSYSDIDRLKKKIEKFIDLERRYARLFQPEDEEKQELRKQVSALQQELKNEREEKLCIISENEEKIQQFNESLNNIKNQMRYLHLEKAKRQHRLKALEQKINKRVDAHSYYHS